MADSHSMLGDAFAVPEIYGVLAEFDSAEQLIDAVHAAREAGFERMDAYSPCPVEGLVDAIGARRTRLPLIVLLGGVAGGVLGYFMQWYMTAISYPLNIGGRPPHTWPAFIPVTFELTILGAALATVFGM